MASEEYQRIGKAIVSLREQFGMPQGELAALTGLSKTLISRLESGQREVPLSKLFAIASLFGMSGGQLVDCDIDAAKGPARRQLRARPGRPVGERFLTTEEVAELARTGASTVRYWRMQGTGPKGVKRGRRVLYPESAVEAWLRGEEEA